MCVCRGWGVMEVVCTRARTCVSERVWVKSLCVRVCMCVCVCVRACVRARARARVYVGVRARNSDLCIFNEILFSFVSLVRHKMTAVTRTVSR